MVSRAFPTKVRAAKRQGASRGELRPETPPELRRTGLKLAHLTELLPLQIA